MYLSIIVPAYNERNRISSTLSRIYEYLRTKNYEYEVIVIDDGSKDETAQAVRSGDIFKSGKVRLIENGDNRGKGFSVKKGITASKGQYVLLSDADLSTPITELDKMFEYIREGYDMVIGSRSVSGARIVVHQPWYRERMGKIFNFFLKLFLLRDFNDTQCGFKLMNGKMAREVATRLKIHGFCFDVEMLYIAKRISARIKETGVIWENSPESTVKVFSSSLNMLFDIFRIKWLHG